MKNIEDWTLREIAAFHKSRLCRLLAEGLKREMEQFEKDEVRERDQEKMLREKRHNGRR